MVHPESQLLARLENHPAHGRRGRLAEQPVAPPTGRRSGSRGDVMVRAGQDASSLRSSDASLRSRSHSGLNPSVFRWRRRRPQRPPDTFRASAGCTEADGPKPETRAPRGRGRPCPAHGEREPWRTAPQGSANRLRDRGNRVDGAIGHVERRPTAAGCDAESRIASRRRLVNDGTPVESAPLPERTGPRERSDESFVVPFDGRARPLPDGERPARLPSSDREFRTIPRPCVSSRHKECRDWFRFSSTARPEP